jgi:drug/metabolite transporter (DMT)-like permease|tara:strand:+ start:40365 stop:41258 length:894 start_codon:yes stop_codon:yes gene_type:complete
MISPRLSAIFVIILWAFCYPLITIGIVFAPHLTFAALRALTAGAVLLLVAVCLKEPLPKGSSTWGWISLTGFGMTGLGYFGMFHAAEFVAPGLATIVANTQPIFAALLGYVLLGERQALRGWIGMLIGFAGILIVAGPQIFGGEQLSTGVGVIYVLLAALGVAAGNVAIKKLANRVKPAMAMGLQLLIGSVPLMIIALLTEQPRDLEWSTSFIFSLLGLAIPGTALAFWLWQSALRDIPLSQANVFSFLGPFFAITIGAVFFAEKLTLTVLIGVGVAAFGVYLATRPEPPGDRAALE